MKNCFLILLLSACIVNVNAQKIKKSAVPDKVKSAFNTKYPEVKKADWEKEGANYEAEFKVSKTETSILLDASGKFLQTETEIAVTALPKSVAEYIQKNVAGKKIKEASRIIESSGKVSYEAEADGKDYIFDENGSFIRIEE